MINYCGCTCTNSLPNQHIFSFNFNDNNNMATFFPRNVIKKLIESYTLLSFSHFDSHVNLSKHYGAPKFRENKMLTWLGLSGFESDYY